MSFADYFDRVASPFNRFYRSQNAARLLGRGAMFDRREHALRVVDHTGALRVADVGCGGGPLFEALVRRGVAVRGYDPAPAMVAMARAEAARVGGTIQVETLGWQDIRDTDVADVSVALGVFDYVQDAAGLLRTLGRLAPWVVASFPSRGLRTRLRQVRYGRQGVSVFGYTRADLERIASEAGLVLDRTMPLGRAGCTGVFRRAP